MLNYRHDSTHTASGLYQITDTLWRSNAPAAGVDLSQYPSAASAPGAVQSNVFGQIVTTRGLSDWTCPGCNPALTQYLADHPDAASLPAFADGTGAPTGAPGMGAGGGASGGAGAGQDSYAGTGAEGLDAAGKPLHPMSGGWVDQITGWLGHVAGRAGLFLVALVFLIGAFLLFGLHAGDNTST